MSEPRWTPEPWVNDDGLVSGRESRIRHAPGPSIDIFDAANWPEELDEEAQANAHLIAAAPDLYEALVMLASFHEAHHNHPIHAAARAALRKAIGKQ